jgi:uncharacterized protein YcfJ
MEMTQASNRIHPLIAGAAVSVTLAALLCAAAIAGIIPSSHGTAAERARIEAQTAAATPVSPSVAAAPAVKEVVEHRTVVHHRYVQHTRPVQVAQAQPVQYSPTQYAPTQYSPSAAPVYQQPAPVAHNSPLGIGVGAVVGGLLGTQVGGGNGRTLATIAGAVGGGYLGNEIAKRNQ